MQLDFEQFRARLMENTPHRPRNFSHIIGTNKQGARLLENLPAISEYKPKTGKEFLAEKPQRRLIDLREATAFGGAHIPGSLNIGLSPNSATWIGNVVDPKAELLLLGNNRSEIDHAATSFRRVGYDQIRGCLLGLTGWVQAGEDTGFLPQISVHSLKHVIEKYPEHLLLDVRTPAEWAAGAITGARHLPLPELIANGLDHNPKAHISVICMSGYRSNIAGSLLKQNGFDNVYSVIGGMGAWRAAGFATDIPQ
jgi:rhodanese-related sulfurtransferase